MIRKKILCINYKIWCLMFGLYPKIVWLLVINEKICNVYIITWFLSIKNNQEFRSLSKKRHIMAIAILSSWDFLKVKVRTRNILRDCKDVEMHNRTDIKALNKGSVEKERDHQLVIVAADERPKSNRIKSV